VIKIKKKKQYNKLIRDRIPEVLDAAGKEYKLRKLKDKEFLDYLNKKLTEEYNEYLESGQVEELADIIEVICAIAEHKKVSVKELEKIRLDKSKKRGTFEKRLLLIEADE